MEQLVNDARTACKLPKDNLTTNDVMTYHKCLRVGLGIASDFSVPRGCKDCGDLKWAVDLVLINMGDCSRKYSDGVWDGATCNKVQSGLEPIDRVIFNYWRQ